MKCPQCGAPTKVINTRAGVDNTTRRRRQCTKCEHRVTTYEGEATFDVPKGEIYQAVWFVLGRLASEGRIELHLDG